LSLREIIFGQFAPDLCYLVNGRSHFVNDSRLNSLRMTKTP